MKKFIKNKTTKSYYAQFSDTRAIIAQPLSDFACIQLTKPAIVENFMTIDCVEITESEWYEAYIETKRLILKAWDETTQLR